MKSLPNLKKEEGRLISHSSIMRKRGLIESPSDNQGKIRLTSNIKIRSLMKKIDPSIQHDEDVKAGGDSHNKSLPYIERSQIEVPSESSRNHSEMEQRNIFNQFKKTFETIKPVPLNQTEDLTIKRVIE